MFRLLDKNAITLLRQKHLLIWTYYHLMENSQVDIAFICEANTASWLKKQKYTTLSF